MRLDMNEIIAIPLVLCLIALFAFAADSFYKAQNCTGAYAEGGRRGLDGSGGQGGIAISGPVTIIPAIGEVRQ